MISYDEINNWIPSLEAALDSVVDKEARLALSKSGVAYVEDALDLLFETANRSNVIDATLEWIRSNKICGYHGSRLTTDEIISIKSQGLIPLSVESRRRRLTRALSSHPLWQDVAPNLDRFLIGESEKFFRKGREGQAHLTLSKAGLIQRFSHYLRYGAEVDQRIAESLMGSEGLQLLSLDGNPYLITVIAPGSVALSAAHPYFDLDHLLESGEVPNLVRHFLGAWSYHIAHPGFQLASLEIDCGMVFHQTIPAEWIASIDAVTLCEKSPAPRGGN